VLSGLTGLKFLAAENQYISQPAVAVGQAIANPLRWLDGSSVKPNDETLCADTGCADLVYPTAGTDIRKRWRIDESIGSARVIFSGVISRDVTGAVDTRGAELADTGSDDAPFGFAAILLVAGAALMLMARRKVSS